MKADVYNTNPDDWYCGDSLCKFNTRPGQHTNGGCTCIDRFDKKQMVMAISKLAQERKQLKARADLFDDLVKALAKALWIMKGASICVTIDASEEDAGVEYGVFMSAVQKLLYKCNTMIPCVRMAHQGDAEGIKACEDDQSIAKVTKFIKDTLTKARALQPDKRAQVAEQNRRAAESQETPEGK